MRRLALEMLVIAGVSAGGAPTAAAQSAHDRPRPPRASARPERQVAVYFEVASILLASGAGISVDYRPLRWFAVSGGFGGGYLPRRTPSFTFDHGVGGQVAGHLLVGDDRWSFDLAIGVGERRTAVHECGVSDCSDSWRETVVPHLSIGMRYQAMSRRQSGLYFRAGLGGVSYGFGGGVVLAIGKAF